MALFRTISMDFWNDTKVADEFSPEDKFFMLYCLTNPQTNLCGCYEVSIKQISRNTGYAEETVRVLLERFDTKYDIVKYNFDTKELLIKNWSKYNWSNSDKLDKPLKKEIEEIKSPDFRNYLAEIYNKRDTVSIRYRYGIDRVWIPYGYN